MNKICLTILLTITNLALAYSEDVDGYFTALSALNRYSPLDGAGSHGGLGAQVGAGAGVTNVSSNSRLLEEQLSYAQSASISEEKQIYQPKFYVLKGIYAPVDVGATYSILETRKISQLMGHVQWTVFESFQLPALALRLHYGKLMGLYSSDFSSTGLDAVASYGLLRYFTFYASLGVQKNYGALRVSKDQPSAYILQGSGNDLEETYQSLQISKLAGLHVQVMPAFAVAVLEGQESANGLRSYLFKLGFGL